MLQQHAQQHLQQHAHTPAAVIQVEILCTSADVVTHPPLPATCLSKLAEMSMHSVGSYAQEEEEQVTHT